MTTITTPSTTEQDRAVAVITLAFSDDPVLRWVLPDSHQFLTWFPQFVSVYAAGAFEHGTAHCTEEFAGVALWLKPGLAPDEEGLGALVEQAVPEARLEEVGAFLEQMAPFHPQEPHWYLPLIGVDPMQRGRGYGSALMQHTLATCDKAGTPAYLEATSPRNKALYERHGFDEIGVIQSGSSPPMWPMVRKPR